MIAFLLATLLAGEPAQAVTDPAQAQALQRCRPALARKVRGEISDLEVGSSRRLRGQTILKGTMNILQRPESKPGEMTAMHIINIPYNYECRLNGRRAPWVRASRLRR
jgi:hypothetical protein